MRPMTMQLRRMATPAAGQGEAHLIALACGEPPEGRAGWTLVGRPAGPSAPKKRQGMLIRGSLRAARLECELIIERTAMSAFIREKKDYTVSFLDGKGQEVYGETMGSDIRVDWRFTTADARIKDRLGPRQALSELRSEE